MLLAPDGVWDVVDVFHMRVVVKKQTTASAYACATTVARAARATAVDRVLRVRCGGSGGFESDDERARDEAEAKLSCDDIGVVVVDIEADLSR